MGAQHHITPEAEASIAAAREANIARRMARVTAEAEARQLVIDRMHEAEVAEARAVQRSLALGVPRQRLSREALGTTDYHTVSRILSVLEPAAQVA